MISLRTNRCLIVLALTLLGSLSWAGEPNEVPIHLEFEVSPTPLPRIFSSEGMEGSTWKAFYSARPAYAVAIPQVLPVEWLPAAERGTMSNFLGRDDTDQRRAGAGYAEEKGNLSTTTDCFFSVHLSPCFSSQAKSPASVPLGDTSRGVSRLLQMVVWM